MSGLMTGLVVTIHIVACLALMVSILLQSGKGGGLAGAFGGGSSQTLFGGRGAAGFLSRASTVLAIVFFVTSLTLGLTSSRSGSARRSLVQDEARRRAAGGTQQPTQAPSQAPGGTAPQAVPPGSPSGTLPGVPVVPGTTPAGPGTTPAPTSPTQTTPAPGSGTGTTPTPASGNGTSPSTGGQ